MLSKKNRLPAQEFKAKNRATLSTPLFTVKFSRNREGHNRFGFIISNSVLKKAVDRHYWKRRLREYVRVWPNSACDILIIVSPRIANAPPESVREELKAAFDKIKKSLTPKNF
ncbi:MAG: hypothetical protein A2945_02240 [Candidatus Liptonbacteria bacterium RIFCSPLOWO2_01_FULL_52_25]|uniref:Uncharacterized protein n=1 Tax=Candidatus Liptonbacteria bacterium RIFCSPLOWO2_01_FULL_52_25 TaxID=1798650 RepID=A0A1G2CEG8_9BACT|nr:MAG: hypothetical protein A2945_02240 [Candidatus Liptonbacteria bacterium RIFCSPLOWO2_01_FULL_52_25]